jgi:hypothetical protein
MDDEVGLGEDTRIPMGTHMPVIVKQWILENQQPKYRQEHRKYIAIFVI